MVIHGRNVENDPHTKIVHQHALEMPCFLGLPPTNCPIEGEYITYLPQRIALKPFDAPTLNLSQDSTQKRIISNIGG